MNKVSTGEHDIEQFSIGSCEHEIRVIRMALRIVFY